MRVKPFHSISIEEDNLAESVELMQSVVEKVLGPLSSIEILNGVLVRDVALTATAARIEHKLGRKPLGYIIIKKDANENVWNGTDLREDLFLNLTASGNVTVSLWIF